MSRLSKGLRKVASKTLNKFGGDITIKRITSGIYNASTGTVSETITSVTIHGILQNVNQRETNDLIKENDKIKIVQKFFILIKIYPYKEVYFPWR